MPFHTSCQSTASKHVSWEFSRMGVWHCVVTDEGIAIMHTLYKTENICI